MFWTTNLTTVHADRVDPSEVITSIDLQSWVGRETDPYPVRVVNDSDDDYTGMVSVSAGYVEVSLDARREYAPALNYSVAAQSVGPTIFVRGWSELSLTEGTYEVTLSALAGPALTVNYSLSRPDTSEDATVSGRGDRLAGEKTLQVQHKFDLYGTPAILIEYTPLPKPDDSLPRVTSIQDLRNHNIREWCNPANAVVGYVATRYDTTAWSGEHVIQGLTGGEAGEIESAQTERSMIALPPDCEAFAPTWRKDLVPFGTIAPEVPAYQGTVWTVLLADGEYALTSIRTQDYYTGEFLYYYSDLLKVTYPSPVGDGYIPWNVLLDSQWRPVSYVSGWSLEAIDEYSEYGGYL
jgi:hypothetical protein